MSVFEGAATAEVLIEVTIKTEEPDVEIVDINEEEETVLVE